MLILLDDVGFGAAGTFGGPVDTPEMDRLAAQGLRYNRFHTTGICSPTRAALLSGRNAHRVGFGTVGEYGYPGYDGIWNKTAVSIAGILRSNGYGTAAFGKWHNTPTWESTPVGPFDRWPTGLGFEHFYGFIQGEDTAWEPTLFRDTTPVEPPRSPAQGYHFSVDIVDEALAWLHGREALAPDRPYFLYLAPGATHAPHHVPEAWIKKYSGKFDQGWDRLREEIIARQKRLGVVPANTSLTPRPAELPAWASLSAEQRSLYAHQMEVYAAYLEHTDSEVGRLIRAVQEGPRADNTLIVYIVGDNGGSGEGGPDGSDIGLFNLLDVPDSVSEQHQRMDRLGGPSLDNHYSAGWAWATSTPFQWMKQVASHLGGTRNPMIVAWPARITDQGGLRSQFAHVNDIAPTLLAAAGLRMPPRIEGVRQISMDGYSLVASFARADAPDLHRVQYFEQRGNRAIYQDGWVAAARVSVPWEVREPRSFEAVPWELYHLEDDFSEAHDLAQRYPAKLAQLRALFDREARRNQVYPLGAAYGSRANPLTLVSGRHEFLYRADLPRMPPSAAPSFMRAHRISATVETGPAPAQGVLLTLGSRYGGFAFYAKDGYLIHEANFHGLEHRVLRSAILIPPGHAELTYEFVLNDGPDGQGIGRLLINGAMVAEAAPESPPPQYLGSLGVGRAFGSAVSHDYEVPFPFNGTLHQVRVSVP